MSAVVKICPKCQEEKPETEFYLQARGYPWRMSKCKTCHNAQSLAALRRRRDALGNRTPKRLSGGIL